MWTQVFGDQLVGVLVSLAQDTLPPIFAVCFQLHPDPHRKGKRRVVGIEVEGGPFWQEGQPEAVPALPRDPAAGARAGLGAVSGSGQGSPDQTQAGGQAGRRAGP